MLHHTRTFEEKRRRSRSADPSRRFRKTDIFFNSEGTANAPQEVSEYAKAFAWPKSQLDSLDEETMKRRLNPCQKQHAAGLSSRKAALNNKAHVIVNSNGSSSIVIANEPTDYALTTGSATNLATLTSSLTQDAIRPLTSMALVDAVDLNKSGSSNGSHMNKSVTITNGINDYANHSADELGSTGSAKKQPKDPNNNISAAPPVQNGLSNGQLNEELLLEKFAKLNTYESIYGKKAGATTLFQRVEVVSPNTLNKMSKKSEYKSKLKPFAQYAYIPGKGWFKPKKIKAKEEIPAKQIEDGAVTPAISIKPQETSSVKSQAIHSISNPVQAVESKAVSVNGQEEQAAPPPAVATPARSAGDEVDAAVEDKQLLWYREAMERKLKANEFRYRSEFGNPILGKFRISSLCSTYFLPEFRLTEKQLPQQDDHLWKRSISERRAIIGKRLAIRNLLNCSRCEVRIRLSYRTISTKSDCKKTNRTARLGKRQKPRRRRPKVRVRNRCRHVKNRPAALHRRRRRPVNQRPLNSSQRRSG